MVRLEAHPKHDCAVWTQVPRFAFCRCGAAAEYHVSQDERQFSLCEMCWIALSLATLGA